MSHTYMVIGGPDLVIFLVNVVWVFVFPLLSTLSVPQFYKIIIYNNNVKDKFKSDHCWYLWL